MTAQRNYAVSPGSYLKEWLQDEDIIQDAAAAKLGVARKTVNQIVRGGNVSPEMAARLGRVTPIDADIWLRIQAQYDADRERLRQEASLAGHVGRLSKQVKSFLKEHGFTTADGRNPGKLADDFLTFHGVATWEAFDECCLEPMREDFALAFRTETRASALEELALLTWLRACDTAPELEGIEKLRYSEKGLRAILPLVRQRSADPDQQMFSDISAMLREQGVVLTHHDAPQSFPLHGVTRWIDGVPVIHQTFRQRRDGFITFTLFHEIGHILNDQHGETHLDNVEAVRKSATERRADEFAWEQLLPGDARVRIRESKTPSHIRRAAAELGVSPGLLVFQLQRTKGLERWEGNDLVVRF